MPERVVAMLRGVNIGGRRVAMAALRDGLTAAGCFDVATYVQSGNVVLTPPGKARGDLAAWLGTTMSDIAGFDVAVVLRTLPELRAVAAANPYPGTAGTQLHVLFAAEPLPAALLSALDLASFAPEHATMTERELYLLLPNGMGRAVLPVAIDKALRTAKVLTTARNWNTVEALIELAER